MVPVVLACGLMTDEFNFDQSVEQAWRRFSLRLANVLSMMDETEPLLLSPCELSDGQWYLRFAEEEKGLISASVPRCLGAEPLNDAQVATLIAEGWGSDDEGFHIVDSQDQTANLAEKSSVVLREVFQVEHPVFVTSNVLTDILTEPAVAEESVGESYEETAVFAYLNLIQLTAAISDELTEILGTPPVRDQDGDFAIRVGSTMIFIRITPDGSEIRLFSIIVHDITGRSRAAEVLNDVNAHTRWVRFSLVRDKIIAAMSLYASPFVPAHLRQAIAEMSKVADGVDDLLASSLQGKTTFPEEVS